MAAGETTLYMNDGSTIDIYSDASAVGSPMHVSITGTATSTSPLFFKLGKTLTIEDMVCASHPTAGVLEIYRNGQRTNKFITTDARFVSTIAGRKKIVPKYTFQAGVKYSFVPTVQTS